MHTEIRVDEGRRVQIKILPQMGEGAVTRMAGASFDIAPAGTPMSELGVVVPEGRQAIAFFCRSDSPHVVGVGRGAQIERSPRFGSVVLLCDNDGDKLVVERVDEFRSPLHKNFNQFILSATCLSVADPMRLIAYVTELPEKDKADTKWTYKLVNAGDVMEYVARHINAKELDERATKIVRAQEELLTARAEAKRLESELWAKTHEASNEKIHHSYWYKQALEAGITLGKLKRAIERSKPLLALLKKWLPKWLWNEAVKEYFTAFDLADKTPIGLTFEESSREQS